MNTNYDLPQLEPERIDELPPRVLDLAQVPPPRDRVEIRRVFLIEPRLRRHDEEHHKGRIERNAKNVTASYPGAQRYVPATVTPHGPSQTRKFGRKIPIV